MSNKKWKTNYPCCDSVVYVPGYDESDICKAVEDAIDLSLDFPK